ncbi:unnamed protein product [Arabidopsis halleri]
MEKIPIKFAFVIFLIVTSVMSTVTVRNVEAKRLLLEEIPQNVLHHEGSP